jgi:hypothetical protein
MSFHLFANLRNSKKSKSNEHATQTLQKKMEDNGTQTIKASTRDATTQAPDASSQVPGPSAKPTGQSTFKERHENVLADAARVYKIPYTRGEEESAFIERMMESVRKRLDRQLDNKQDK